VKGVIESISQLGLAFFGLTSDTAPQARAALFKQIHEMVFHGKGGYDWYTIYDMPTWLRKFTFNEMQKFYKEESESTGNTGPNNKGSKTLIDPSGKVNTPEFLEASKQYKKPAKYK
jgi:hypothetical protein